MNGIKKNLTPNEFYLIIINYYKKKENIDVQVINDLKIENNDLSMNIYVVKNYEKIELLSLDDISCILIDYLDEKGLDFIDFKYIGNIRKPGMYVDEMTPVFQGIQLLFEKQNKLELKKD